MTSDVVVVEGPPLRGSVAVPGDKSISHRALLLAARAAGMSVLRHLSDGDDVRRTLAAVAALGCEVDEATAARPRPGGIEASGSEIRLAGGPGRLHEPGDVLDLGNSGTGMRLLAGYLAAFPSLSVLGGDDSLRSRPMRRVVDPLRQMGARIDGRDDGNLAPLTIRGGGLRGLDYTLPVASAQVKSAILLAGLGADGATTVREPVPTRIHTEELFALAGIGVEMSSLPGGGRAVTVEPGEPRAFELDIPCDPSQAAFFIVAACITPGSEVECERVYVGPGRAGFLDVLERMGARIERRSRDATTADIVAAYGPLYGTVVGGDEVPGLIDEVPVLAVAASLAEGTTTFGDVGELRVKESDRIATVTGMLAAAGARVESTADSLTVVGSEGLAGGATVAAAGDHRIAMAAAVAGLRCRSPLTVTGFEGVATSYPRFVEDLEGLRCR